MSKKPAQPDMRRDALQDLNRQATRLAEDSRIAAEAADYLKTAKPDRRITSFDLSQDSLNAQTAAAQASDILLATGGRDAAEHTQDIGAGLMGAFGAMGSVLDLGVNAVADTIANLPAAMGPQEATWDRTAGAFERAGQTSEYWNSLKTQKSQAFQRVAAQRTAEAVQQAEQDAALAGENFTAFDRILQEGLGMAGEYLQNPGQVGTEAIAQMPYLLTGGVAKGLTTASAAGQATVRSLIARGLTQETAEKMVQMGIVGGLQGSIEGTDAAASAYERVIGSENTFGPGQEGERESAAMRAALEAFALTGSVSAFTGAAASKFDLAPFSAAGNTAVRRTGDNLYRALQEGLQEAVESGMGAYAPNLAGNRALGEQDQVALEEGVGGAIGTGIVVGAGSTLTTNPRAFLDAAITPVAVTVGAGINYLGRQAASGEQKADMAEAMDRASAVMNSITSPAAMAVVNEPPKADAPVEEIVLPEGIDTTSRLGLFNTGMAYLRGKDHNSEDSVEAFHVMGAVLSVVPEVIRLRDALREDLSQEGISPEERAAIQENLNRVNNGINEQELARWVEEFPLDKIEERLVSILDNPESFGATIAKMVKMRPLQMPTKLVDQALEAKSLSEGDRQSLLLSKELQEAEAELRVGVKPNSSEVSRSIMQTGFPGASDQLLSIADMIGNVTKALDSGENTMAQVHFNRLASFSNYLTNRSGRFDQAMETLANNPDLRTVEVPSTRTWDNKTRQLTDSPFVLYRDRAKSLDVVPAVRKDAQVVAKMVQALQARTGLVLGGTEQAAQQDPTPVAPSVAPEAAQPVAAPVVTETQPAPLRAAEEVSSELADLSDQALVEEVEALEKAIAKRKSADTPKALEQDIRYRELVREEARRFSKQAVAPVVAPAPAPEAAPEPKPAPVVEVVEVIDPVPAVEPEAVQEVPVAKAQGANRWSQYAQPDYPVAENATVADRNDAINHLAHSFTEGDQKGLVAKGRTVLSDRAAFLEEVAPETDRDNAVVGAVFSMVQTVQDRLNKLLRRQFTQKTLAKMVAGENKWKDRNGHSLYAARWTDKNIAYLPSIANIMAWTGVQQLLDMAYPVKWNSEKIAGFVETYGESIQQHLQDGWVPASEQIQKMARNLQNNMQLKAVNNVPIEYTEGTMLALAADTLEAMVLDGGYSGPIEVLWLSTTEGVPVRWIRTSSDPEVLMDAAHLMKDFFADGSESAVAIINKKPTKVNTQFRGSRQKIGEEQRIALLSMSQKEHRLSPLLLKMWDAIDEESGKRLFGYKELSHLKPGERPSTIAEIEQNGANQTLLYDMRAVMNHINEVRRVAGDADITSIPSYFEYEMVVNGRAMTKGISPQSSKLYREIFSTTQATIDPNQENRVFMMAVAQGLGAKMDKASIDENLAQLKKTLAKPEVQRALEGALRFGNGDMSQVQDDLAAFEASGIEMTPHALSALVHMAKYQQGEPFVSSLSYEIDGLTDGPINMMMLLGLHDDSQKMEPWLGLAGLWFGEAGTKISVQDRIDEIKTWFDGNKDMYEIIADRTSELNNNTADVILANIDPREKAAAERYLRAINHLLNITKMSSFEDDSGVKHTRAMTKKPTQASGYQQGSKSIINDLLSNITTALSQRIDAGQMTDMDYAALDEFTHNRIGYNNRSKQYYLKQDIAEFRDVDWNGQTLTAAQKKVLGSALFEYGGGGLVDATYEVISRQRGMMGVAVDLVNARIQYAQYKLEQAYRAKQAEKVATGELRDGQALSKKDENEIINQVWDKDLPLPVFRGTAGLPIVGTTRQGAPKDNIRSVQGLLKSDMNAPNQNLQVSDASFEAPGVAFAALSIMASGDGAMMTGTFPRLKGNALNMFDGIYIDPSEIDTVGEIINEEVKKNWEFDYITAVLDSINVQDTDFMQWAEQMPVTEDLTLASVITHGVQVLSTQREVQKSVMRSINSRPHYVSHMAGHENPPFFDGKPLESSITGKPDPLLDLAADSLGTVSNGIRRMTKADVLSLLRDHTFENPVLSGLWKVLSPMLSDDLTLYMSNDRLALGEFYNQNERLTMGDRVDGIAVGDRVYIRNISAETIIHELLHHTTKNLSAKYYSNPVALTAQQRNAMGNLTSLMNQFLGLNTESFPPAQGMLIEHAQSVIRGYLNKGDQNSAMQEFLAYGLSNYHIQRALGDTKSRLGKLLDSIFSAVKRLFGFPNGTQSDSMLAQMLSNFENLTAGMSYVTSPISIDVALESVNPDLARSYGAVLHVLEKSAKTITQSIRARNLGRTRMQELADTGLFNFTDEQQAAGEYVQAIFAAGLQMKPDINGVMQRLVDALREFGPSAFRTNDDPSDQGDIALGQDRFAFFFENVADRHDRAADIMALSLVSPEFNERLSALKLPRQSVQKDTLNSTLDTAAKALFDWLDTGVKLDRNAPMNKIVEAMAMRIRQSMLASAKRQQYKPGAYRRFTEKLSEGVQWIGDRAGKMAQDRVLSQEDANRHVTAGLAIFAGTFSDNYADLLGKTVLSLSNHMESYTPVREAIQEIVGTVSDNFKLVQLKGKATRKISAVRQVYREQMTKLVNSWFKDMTEEQDATMFRVVGQAATYTLSQNLKERMEEILTDPTNAILDAQNTLLAAGNRRARSQMVSQAKNLGDWMMGAGNVAVYRNTKAIQGLAAHGGGDSLSAAEMAALEDLSTLQALTHLTKGERQRALDLLRNQPNAYWQTTAMIHALQQNDTTRAGQGTATLNFQKGWVPTETDNRKKIRVVHPTQIRAMERKGWVNVGQFTDDFNSPDYGLVYMATTAGKVPALSGGAIHAVDYHMNGVHYHSGMPIGAAAGSIVTDPKEVKDLLDDIQAGYAGPYAALYDASGNLVGFQRSMDPAVVRRHTAEIHRISEAAGAWLGRQYEERVAFDMNQVSVDLLGETWEQAKGTEREAEFVNIRDPKDKVLSNVWQTLPYHTKRQLEDAFADGSRTPPIMIRRDQLNDAVGYHKASVTNFFTGDNRYNKQTNDQVSALARQFLGKNAYKYLAQVEDGLQGIVGTAKDTIIVKSLVVAVENLLSNQTQLAMLTGNPIWNARVQAQKYKEITLYLGYQQRIAKIQGEKLIANAQRKIQIDAETVQLQTAMRKLSIHPLVEAGEFPTIAEGLSEMDEFSLVGDFTRWSEQQLGRLPPVVQTVVDNIAVAKHTSLYKGLDRLVQYGDFVAKATMYEWLTTQKGKGHEEALAEVNDEFVNYARLPGRWRTYGEDIGVLWFYNYKLRIMKMIFRRMRQNPFAFVVGNMAGSALGIQTLWDSLPHNVNYDYATGFDPLYSAHGTIIWNQLF